MQFVFLIGRGQVGVFSLEPISEAEVKPVTTDLVQSGFSLGEFLFLEDTALHETELCSR